MKRRVGLALPAAPRIMLSFNSDKVRSVILPKMAPLAADDRLIDSVIRGARAAFAYTWGSSSSG
jgi:hypothetical protein